MRKEPFYVPGNALMIDTQYSSRFECHFYRFYVHQGRKSHLANHTA